MKKILKGLDKKIRGKLQLDKSSQLDISHGERVLIVSPHPDDETLGCASVLLNCGENYDCDVLLVTDGQKGNPEWTEEKTVLVRNNEFQKAMSMVNVKNIYYLHLMDSELKNSFPNKWYDNTDGIVKEKYKDYTSIFLPNKKENHPDHQKTYRVLRKKIRGGVRVYQYEVWTPISAPSDLAALDDAQMQKKISLIENYKCQLNHIDYIKRIKGLNCYRGMFINSEYAEAYLLEKSLLLKFLQCLYLATFRNLWRIYGKIIHRRI